MVVKKLEVQLIDNYMSHLDTIKLIKEMPKKERIFHEGLDFIHFWLTRDDLDVFEAMILYQQHRVKLLGEKYNL